MYVNETGSRVSRDIDVDLRRGEFEEHYEVSESASEQTLYARHRGRVSGFRVTRNGDAVNITVEFRSEDGLESAFSFAVRVRDLLDGRNEHHVEFHSLVGRNEYENLFSDTYVSVLIRYDDEFREYVLSELALGR